MPFSLGSSAQLGIGIAINLQNNFSGQAARVNQDLLNMRKNSNMLVQQAIRDSRNQSAAIAAGAGLMTKAMFNATEQSSEFQHRINQVFIVGGQNLGKSREQLEQFARKQSRVFAIDQLGGASAMFENVKAGVTSNLEEITKYQIAAAKATDEPIEGAEGVAAKLLGITNAAGVSMDKFKDIANGTTAAANASMASIRDIGESMEYAAFTAKQFNIPWEKTEALVAKLSQSKITGSAAGTALNNMILYLGAATSSLATPKQAKMFEMLGLDRKQMADLMNKGDIFSAISTMDKAMSGIDPTERVKMLANITNMRGTRGMLGSWGSTDPSKSLEGLYGSIHKGVTGDIAMTQAKAMQNDLYSDIQFFHNAVKDIGISFVKAVTPMARVVLPALSKGMHMIGEILESPIGKVFGSIVAVGLPIVTLMFGWRAAILTGTMALNMFTRNLQVGGFRGLFGAGMNMAGTNLWQAGMKGMPAGVAMNTAGRLYATGAAPINFGGKTYTRGFLPSAYSKSIGMGSPTMQAGSWLGRGMSFLGLGGMMAGGAGAASGAATTGILGTLGTIAGFVGRLVPIVGGIFALYSIAKLILGEQKKANDSSPEAQALLNEYYSKFSGNLPGGGAYNNPWEQRMNLQSLLNNGQKQPLQLTINTTVDGRTWQSKTYDDTMENNMAKQIDVNLNGF